MENRYSATRSTVESRPEFIDLINTNFHQCGFVYPRDRLRSWVDEYLHNGHLYHADPAGSLHLREQIAKYYSDAGLTVRPDCVVVTASASESYSHIFAGCDAGDRVLLPRPGYPLFEDIAGRFGLKVDFYLQDRSEQWRIDPAMIESHISTRTVALVLISPNNPTGAVIEEDVSREIGTLCKRRGIRVVVDEVFAELTYGDRPPRPAELMPETQVYTINGASKLFASPDLKISWITCTGPETSEVIEEIQIQNDLFLSASALSQHVVTRMFESGMEFSQNMRREIMRRRETMLEEVEKTPWLTCIPPQGGIHLPLEVTAPGKHDDETIAVDLMNRFSVAVHPGYLYGISGPATIVTSFLGSAQRIAEGFARIRDYMGDAGIAARS